MTCGIWETNSSSLFGKLCDPKQMKMFDHSKKYLKVERLQEVSLVLERVLIFLFLGPPQHLHGQPKNSDRLVEVCLGVAPVVLDVQALRP